MKQHMATHRNGDDNCRNTSSPSSENSFNEDIPSSGGSTENHLKEDDKIDSGIKREREGELSLPEAKRSLGK